VDVQVWVFAAELRVHPKFEAAFPAWFAGQGHVCELHGPDEHRIDDWLEQVIHHSRQLSSVDVRA
jgi:hypothetical protein